MTPTPPLARPYLLAFARSACAAAGGSSCPISHGRGVVKSFRIDDCEVETDVWQPRVPPCVHAASRASGRSPLVATCANACLKTSNPHRAAPFGLIQRGISVHAVLVRQGGPSTWLPLCRLVSTPVQPYLCVDAEFNAVQWDAFWAFLRREFSSPPRWERRAAKLTRGSRRVAACLCLLFVV